MKILVISDTHKYLTNARVAIKDAMKRGLSGVIHCGDHIEDAQKLEVEFPGLQFYYVPGNCDGWGFTSSERTKVIQLEDEKVLITHGDHHNIKYNYDELLIDVRAHGACVGLCGHSHRTYVQREGGITIVNPGSISLPRDCPYPSYAILEIIKDRPVHVTMMMIKDGCPSLHLL